MQRYYFIIIAIIIFFPGLLLAQKDNDKEIPEGMQIRMIGQTALVVPEGAEIQEKDGLIIVESIDKYVARSLFQIKKSIELIEKQQQEIIKEIQQFKSESKAKEEK